MNTEEQRWIEAGGSADLLALLRLVGRVRVFADGDSRILAGIHPDLPHVGALSHWVGGSAILARAEAWLAEQGCTVVRAPMELCTWFTYRVSLGPHDDAPYGFEPTERPERWTEAGYHPTDNYVSALIHHEEQIERAIDPASSLSAKGWRVEALNAGPDGTISDGTFLEVVEILHRISSASFSQAHGYADIPLQAAVELYRPFKRVVDPRQTLVAFAPDGKPGGFCFAVSDWLQPERNWQLIKTLAVHPDHQGLGLGNWLFGRAHKVARDLGMPASVHCLLWQGSKSNLFTRPGDRVFRNYTLLEKKLT